MSTAAYLLTQERRGIHAVHSLCVTPGVKSPSPVGASRLPSLEGRGRFSAWRVNRKGCDWMDVRSVCGRGASGSQDLHGAEGVDEAVAHTAHGKRFAAVFDGCPDLIVDEAVAGLIGGNTK